MRTMCRREIFTKKKKKKKAGNSNSNFRSIAGNGLQKELLDVSGSPLGKNLK